LVDERRRLGRALAIDGIDASCDRSGERLAARFPVLARQSALPSIVEPMDRDTATLALVGLQAPHDSELAAVVNLRVQIAAKVAAGPTGGRAGAPRERRPTRKLIVSNGQS